MTQIHSSTLHSTCPTNPTSTVKHPFSLDLLQASVCPNTIWFFVSWHLGVSRKRPKYSCDITATFSSFRQPVWRYTLTRTLTQSILIITMGIATLKSDEAKWSKQNKMTLARCQGPSGSIWGRNTHYNLEKHLPQCSYGHGYVERQCGIRRLLTVAIGLLGWGWHPPPPPPPRPLWSLVLYRLRHLTFFMSAKMAGEGILAPAKIWHILPTFFAHTK